VWHTRRLGDGDPIHLWDKFDERDYGIVLSFVEISINKKRRRYDFVRVRGGQSFNRPVIVNSVGQLGFGPINHRAMPRDGSTIIGKRMVLGPSE
jgi:hypothetical protein